MKFISVNSEMSIREKACSMSRRICLITILKNRRRQDLGDNAERTILLRGNSKVRLSFAEVFDHGFWCDFKFKFVCCY